jgi:diacylglycerol kinase family enzyme
MTAARVCVIYNPVAGKGRARARLGRLRRILGALAEFWPSKGPGDAEEQALRAAQDGFPLIAAAGGDGTVHEVANGLLRSGLTGMTFAVIPIGSANDYAFSLGLDEQWWLRPDPAVSARLVDVGVVQSAQRRRFFVNGLGLGFNGAITVESRRIKHFQGLALYGLAMLRALWSRFSTPRMTVQLDDAAPRTTPTLALSLALGRREGNFVIAPKARLDDGLFDYVHAGPLRRRDLLTFVPSLITGWPHSDHPAVWEGHCRRALIQSEAALTVHLDGEFFCLPQHDVRDLQVELLPDRLRVLGRWHTLSS